MFETEAERAAFQLGVIAGKLQLRPVTFKAKIDHVPEFMLQHLLHGRGYEYGADGDTALFCRPDDPADTPVRNDDPDTSQAAWDAFMQVHDTVLARTRDLLLANPSHWFTASELRASIGAESADCRMRELRARGMVIESEAVPNANGLHRHRFVGMRLTG